MRLKITFFIACLLILLPGIALRAVANLEIPQAVSYYVSSSGGSDSNNGLSESKPFRTITKVNSLALQPGDQVRFKCGDTWQGEQLVISKSGSESAPVIFGSYPVGCTEKPVLSGSLPISGWGVHAGNIYKATLNTSDFPLGINQLFRDDTRLKLGRWPNLDAPNAGYSFVNAHTAGSAQISDNELLNSVDWTGAVVHIKNIRWSMLTRNVTGSSGNTLSLNAGFSCLISSWGSCAGWGYFLNNHLATLDQDGEWYYDEANHVVYLYSSMGAPTNIEGSVIQENATTLRHGGIMLSDGSATAYVVVDNFVVKNWFNHGISTPGGMNGDIYHHITVRNVIIRDVDSAGVWLSSWLERPTNGRKGLRGGHHLTFENNIIDGANAFGITGYFAESTFTGNTIRNIALIANLGKSGMSCGTTAEQCTENGDGLRIRLYDVRDSGFGNTLRYNRFEKTGYNAVDIFGPETLLERNFITLACYSKADCGGVRVFGKDNLTDTSVYNVRLIENIIEDIPGNVDGCEASRKAFGMGIYIDHYSRDVEVRKNTVISTTITGILYQRSTGQITDNTVYNASTGTEYSAHISLGGDETQVNISGNKLLALNNEAWTLYTRTLSNVVSSDYNYVFHPYVEKHIAFGPSWTRYTFSGWQSFSGLESHSIPTWYTQTAGETPRSRILYNDTQNSITFELGMRKYLDLEQNDVLGLVALGPFTSLILVDNGDAGLQLLSMTPTMWGEDSAADFTLILHGTGFTANSIIRWNGSDRPTTFVSANTLTASITAADVSLTGPFAVVVYDPAGNPTQTPPLIFQVVAHLWQINLPLVMR